VAEQAQSSYDLFRSNPRHPSLHFKRVFTNDPLVSVRVGRDTAPLAWSAKLARFCGSGSARMKRTKRFSEIADAEFRYRSKLGLPLAIHVLGITRKRRPKMFNAKVIARNIALAGALPLLVASSAFAQYGSYPGTYRTADRGYANRTVEGTVASVSVARNGGEHVRLTSGMDVVVPPSITGMYQNRRYQAAMLVPGDVVRLNVYSREGDGRDAQVRSMEILSRYENNNYGRNGNNGYRNGNNGWNDRLITGTVVSYDRRSNLAVIQTDNGRTVNVNVNAYGGRNAFRRGDRVNISGRMDRGTFVADGVRIQ
jgi:hypothetical protein